MSTYTKDLWLRKVKCPVLAYSIQSLPLSGTITDSLKVEYNGANTFGRVMIIVFVGAQ